jgi:ubiquinone/menaquinone biosynthesis C-methylase UbiE
MRCIHASQGRHPLLADKMSLLRQPYDQEIKQIKRKNMITETVTQDFSSEEIEKNHEVFLKRNALYKEYGMDQEELRRCIVRLVEPQSKSLLEIGTGKGYLTSMLAGAAVRITSVDTDNTGNRIAMLNAAYYNRLDNIEFITADACGMNFPDRSFDAVVSAFTFHHFDLPFKALREMARVADRQLIISDFNERGFEAVAKVHVAEGGRHDRKPADFSIVGVYLKEFNFDVTVIEQEWQTIY